MALTGFNEFSTVDKKTVVCFSFNRIPIFEEFDLVRFHFLQSMKRSASS